MSPMQLMQHVKGIFSVNIQHMHKTSFKNKKLQIKHNTFQKHMGSQKVKLKYTENNLESKKSSTSLQQHLKIL